MALDVVVVLDDRENDGVCLVRCSLLPPLKGLPLPSASLEGGRLVPSLEVVIAVAPPFDGGRLAWDSSGWLDLKLSASSSS